MRVIAGTAKGRRLQGPKRGAAIRPVLDQVKEAIFNILYDVSGLRVLDCFAGTGAIGIEALSRGAREAVFIDASKTAIDTIRTNLEWCRLTSRAALIHFPAERGIRLLASRKAQFDLLFIDPPYEKNLVNPSLRQVYERGLLAPAGTIIIEHHPKEVVKPPDGLALTDERKYGQTLISFLQETSRETL